jgi:hypothetical protein
MTGRECSVMSDELNWNFADRDDAKAEIRAAVEYLLRDYSGTERADIVLEIIQIVRDAANSPPPGGQNPLDEDMRWLGAAGKAARRRRS